MTTYVCPDKDIVCGDRQANWCAACPKRKPVMTATTDDTICDRCGCELPISEANDGPPGEWDGAALCNNCYAVAASESEE